MVLLDRLSARVSLTWKSVDCLVSPSPGPVERKLAMSILKIIAGICSGHGLRVFAEYGFTRAWKISVNEGNYSLLI